MFYLASALSRALSVALDGTPTGGLFLAGAVELALGPACCCVLLPQRRAG